MTTTVPHRRRALALPGLGLAACLIVGAAAGCGGDDGPTTMRLNGEVTYDGKPVEDGKITLTPTGETPGGSVAGEIKEGRYDIPRDAGPISGGAYKVEISSLAKKGKALPNVVDPGGPSLAVFEELIPRKYNAESTLTVNVSEDSSKNVVDFKLDKAGR